MKKEVTAALEGPVEGNLPLATRGTSRAVQARCPTEDMSSQTATVTHSKGDATTSSRLPSTTKGKEKTGEETTPFSAPTAVELYKRMPQVPEATYKAEGTFLWRSIL